uniref:Uncharacterized protein n=1 Tax=Myoviridae sp. ct9MV2 TaxID=2826625 RepID=A0A8S5NBU4_9CAUD|nr:MAG TPA: hypothetical protein [Myoviridae sp. ct9MV2]
MDKRKYKRRSNILYRLRKKHIRCNTRDRTIFYPVGLDHNEILQIRQLMAEYNFAVQLEIT